MDIFLGLLAVLALILANGYFVAAEFAYVAARRSRLEELAAAGDRKAARALDVTRRLSFMLSGAQLGITVTSLVVGFIAEPVFVRALAPLFDLIGLSDAAASATAITTGFGIATAGQMVLGELGPKNLAIAAPERFARALAGVTRLYMRVAGPVIRLFDASANHLLRAIGVEPVEELAGGVDADELAHIIAESHRGGALGEQKAELLRRVLGFPGLRAGDAMMPRTRVASLSVDDDCGRLRRLALESGHSRFPVVGDGLDDVKGLVVATDMLRLPAVSRDRAPVRALLQPALAVPESAQLGQLLADMRGAGSELAIVVDEYGGTAGIVTREDIVEELVGSIQDEYDRGEPAVSRQPDGSFLVPGAWRVDETIRDTGIELPEGDYDTLGGLLMERLGRVPGTGDVLDVGTATLHVEAMQDRAVARVRLRPAAGEPSDGWNNEAQADDDSEAPGPPEQQR